MAAHHHLNRMQLPLFMTGKELKDSMVSSYDLLRHDEPMEDMWSDKIKGATRPAGSGKHGSGVYDSLEREGWNGRALNVLVTDEKIEPHPDYIDYDVATRRDGSMVSANAHHRIAAAAKLEEEGKRTVFIPLNHSADSRNK
jgi:hypothetical protein